MNISEECHKDIIDLVEQYINKDNVRNLKLARLQKRGQDLMNSGVTDKVRQTADGKSVIGAPDVANELNSIKKRIQELRGKQGGTNEALLDLVKPKKKKEISPKMLELRDKILKANKVEEPPKQHKRKIEVPKVTVQGVFGEAFELVEARINEVSKELARTVFRERINNKDKTGDKYNKTRDSKDFDKHMKASVKFKKHCDLIDKWDILKGLKRGKDGKFHDKTDYKEYKEKYE